MAQLGLWATVKEWIGGVAFAIFLWSQSLTADEYFDLLERDAEQSVHLTASGAGGRGQNSLQSSFIADDPSAKHGGK